MEKTAVPVKTNWFLALTLQERADLLESLSSLDNLKLDLDNKFNSIELEAEIKRWKKKTTFNDKNYLQERLAVESISYTRLKQILTLTSETLAESSGNIPDWLTSLLDTLQTETEKNFNSSSYFEAENKLLISIHPLINKALQKLQNGLERLANNNQLTLIEPANLKLFLPGLLTQLHIQLYKTVVLELNIARLRGQLVGNDSESRFESFINNLGKPGASEAFLEEYPVLARQLATTINNWVNYSLEFSAHLYNDWAGLQAAFALGEAGTKVTEISAGAGDTHRNGRSVVKIKFSSAKQVVYKPRSLKLDSHFQDLLRWLNTKGTQPAFRTFEILDKGEYSWVEFIEAKSCQSEAELQRFYERQGAYLALLYALKAVDFHYENLIAAGEDPVLIDLEAIFHPHLPTNFAEPVEYSTLLVGLLPRLVMGSDEASGIDLSGLGGGVDQTLPYQVKTWQQLNTDQMQLNYRQVVMPGASNRPSLQNQTINAADYLPQIKAGFVRQYELLCAYREELIAGQLKFFEQDEIRVILRSTRVYGRMLEESYHPTLLRDALERDLFFDKLWAAVAKHPYLPQIIPSERQDLWAGDIPMFTASVSGRDLYNSRGERIADFLPQAGLDAVTEHVRHLNPDDLACQLWFIEASFASVSNEAASVHGHSEAAAKQIASPESVEASQLLAEAAGIGDRLCQLAEQREVGVNWYTLDLVKDRDWEIKRAGLDFYDGTPGIVFFLAYLGQLSGNPRYTKYARAGLANLQDNFKRKGYPTANIGAFDGLGGLIYLYAHLGALWQDSSLIQAAQELQERLPELIGQDNMLDITGGAAGCLLGLASLYQVAPNSTTLELARLCGERLVKTAVKLPSGTGWFNFAGSGKVLAGFSHGVAGIAVALCELAELTGDERYQQLALDSLEYERAIFVESAQNWPDLRQASQPENSTPRFLTAWCHGAAGVGLSRVKLLDYTPSEVVAKEAEIALQTTLQSGFGKNHSLCHGDMGNLEPLLLAAQRSEPGMRAYQGVVARLTGQIIAGQQISGWINPSPLNVDTPGLMTGLAGIGYQLLRLAQPAQVPAVLLVAPPVKR